MIVSRRQWLLPVALLIFLAATNRWLSFDEGVEVMHATDTVKYMRIARAAPQFPSESMDSAFAQRFFFPYLVGCVSGPAGVSTEQMFRIFTLICILSISLVFYNILHELRPAPHGLTFFLSLFILNPYQFRYYIAVPAMLTDQIFVLGLILCIYALIKKKGILLFTGILIAGLARQTVLAMLPGVSFWLLFGGGYRNRSIRWLWMCVAWMIGLATYFGTAEIVAPFSLPRENFKYITSIFFWMADSFNPAILAEFLFRAAIPFIFPSACLIGMRLGTRRRFPDQDIFWGCLVMSLCIFLQPMLSGPGLIANNVTRLAALGLAPFLLSAAVAANQWQVFHRPPAVYFLIAIGLIVLASFHHMYSLLAGDTDDAKLFALIYYSAGIMTASICYWLARKSAESPPTTETMA